MKIKTSGLSFFYWTAVVISALITEISSFSFLGQVSRYHQQHQFRSNLHLVQLNAVKISPVVAREIERQKWLKREVKLPDSKDVKTKPGEAYQSLWEPSSDRAWFECERKIHAGKEEKPVKVKANEPYQLTIGRIDKHLEDRIRANANILNEFPKPEAIESLAQTIQKLRDQCAKSKSSVEDINKRINSLSKCVTDFKDSDEESLEDFIQMNHNIDSTPLTDEESLEGCIGMTMSTSLALQWK